MASTPANNLTLVSTGLADARLQPTIGNPLPNQFLKVLRKTTRWAAQWNRVDFDGSPEFGQRVSLTLPRIGELVSGFNIVVTMPDIYGPQLAALKAAGGTDHDNPGNFLGPTYGWTNSLGHALIQQIELEIGGAIVETLDSRLLEILDELYETLESAQAKNAMIKRKATGFGERTWLTDPSKTGPFTVTIPIPFWFSRPGVYSHALPIEALKSDNVRVHVTFRPIESLYYTSARVDSRTIGFRPGQDVEGTMWGLQGGRFWCKKPDAATTVYSMSQNSVLLGDKGELIQGHTMPPKIFMPSAYALVEYISLEEYEALSFRSAELTYHVEQHLAVPVEQTKGQAEVRLAIPYSNPTKELLWVFQRPEAEAFNAWFLFTRDLAQTIPSYLYDNPCLKPWWPDADLIPKQENDWQIVPGFQTAFSEPMTAATLLYNSYERVVQDGGSFFRVLVPAEHYVKPAIHNRYVYAYSFAQKAEFGNYEPAGQANWDKIPRKEFFLRMAKGRLDTKPPNMNLYVYTTIWNVFKVFGGRGAMLFTS